MQYAEIGIMVLTNLIMVAGGYYLGKEHGRRDIKRVVLENLDEMTKPLDKVIVKKVVKMSKPKKVTKVKSSKRK